MSEPWQDAHVTYADWTGTAQLDQSKARPSIEKIAGLSYDDWLIVGIDIHSGEHSHTLSVLAIDRSIVPEGGDVLPKIAAANGGSIPVTEMLVHRVDPYEVLKALTHEFSLHLRRRGARDHPITIVARGDANEPED